MTKVEYRHWYMIELTMKIPASHTFSFTNMIEYLITTI